MISAFFCRRVVAPVGVLLCAIPLVHAAPRRSAPPKPAGPTASTASPVSADQLRSLRWRALGPANMSGRISEITPVPGKPSQFFVATGTGGLFKTVNDGATFTAVFDDQPTLSIGSVAVAPTDPKILYVGTGEGNGRNSSTWGNGVYKSTDGGGAFTHVGLPDSRDIPRLAIDPRRPDVVYAAVLGHLWDANRERGLYRTTDGGKTWQPALQFDADVGCVDVLLDPNNPDTVYAAMYARRRQTWSFQSGFGDKGGIYKSTDGGQTFRRLSAGLPAHTGRIGLALFAKDPSHVYAIVESDDRGASDIDDQFSRGGGLFRSTDSGESWTRISGFNPRPFYFSKIVVDPADEKRLYVLGFGLALSDDGGVTFRGDGALLPHGDMHSLVVDPADTDHLLMGTDGGIYESRDRAKTWRYIRNLALGEFYEVGLGMDQPYTVCGGLQDNGTWCGPSRGQVFFGESEEKRMNQGEADWQFVWDGDGFYAQVDPRDPNIVYAEAQQGRVGRIDRRTGRIKVAHPADKEGKPAYRFNWNSPLVLSKHDPDTLYLGGNVVFKITGRGAAWQPISPDVSGQQIPQILTAGSGAEGYGTITTIAESPLKAGWLWVGTDDGVLHLTRDDGAHWEKLAWPAGAPAGTYVSRIEASHVAPETALVSFDGHRTGDNRPYIFETRDGGRTWLGRTGDLPADQPVKVVREDPVNPELLFAGTEFGVFATLDRGTHWIPLRGESLPAVMVHDLQIHPRDKDLVAGTHGRSIYILDDITGLEQLTPANLAKSAVLLQPRPAAGFYLLERGGMWGADQFGVPNPPPGANLNYWVKERNYDGAKLKITDSHGQLVRELKGPAEAGLNRVTWDLTQDKEARIEPREHQVHTVVQPLFVAAGEYKVTLRVGKEESTATLTVAYPPGVGPEPTAP